MMHRIQCIGMEDGFNIRVVTKAQDTSVQYSIPSYCVIFLLVVGSHVSSEKEPLFFRPDLTAHQRQEVRFTHRKYGVETYDILPRILLHYGSHGFHNSFPVGSFKLDKLQSLLVCPGTYRQVIGQNGNTGSGDSVVEQIIDRIVNKQRLTLRPVQGRVVRKNDENKIIKLMVRLCFGHEVIITGHKNPSSVFRVILIKRLREYTENVYSRNHYPNTLSLPSEISLFKNSTSPPET